MVKQKANLDAVFSALGDPTRRAMVRMLAQREHNIGELAAPFAMSLVAASKHVKTLERAGLVKRRIRGRMHACRLEASALAQAHQWIGVYECFWNHSLDALEALVAENKGARK